MDKIMSASGEIAGYRYKGVMIHRSVLKIRKRRTSERRWKVARQDLYGADRYYGGIHTESFRTLAEAKNAVDKIEEEQK